MRCTSCDDDRCRRGEDCFGMREEARPAYDDPIDRPLMRTAAEVEAEGYGKLTRVEELIAFCKKLPALRVGIAFCVGLSREADLVAQALERQGFEVHSVCCKACGLSKDDLALPRLHEGGFEAACNPIGQALLLNHERTDVNAIVGLCVGHDMLFARHSAAPVTTLIAKDRVLGHNPAAVLYSSYLRKRLGLSSPSRGAERPASPRPPGGGSADED
jgi:uncharacterized metal-binding protein